MTLEEIIAKLQELATALQEILDQTAPTQAQLDQADEIVKQIDALEAQKAAAEKLIETKAANAARIKALADYKKPHNPLPPSSKVDEPGQKVYATPRRAVKYFENADAAYKAGRFFQAALGNSAEAKSWLEQNGVDFKALTSNVEGGAGLFVLPEVETAIIRLVEEYGIIRKYAANKTMRSDTRKTWKRIGGNTGYWLTENGTPTSTDASWQTLTGVAKVLGALTKYSLILEADAAIDVAQEITPELALALATSEDQAGFIGDGTSTYGGIIGAAYAFRKVLEDAGGTWTNDTHKGYLGSAVVAAGNNYSEVTLQNFIDTKNKVAKYPGMKPAWYIHDVTAAATMERLQYALSGNAAPNTIEGQPAKFLGFPVVYCNAMYSTEANSQVIALFGDLSMSTNFYDRQGMEVGVNTQSETNFLQRSAQVLATERIDILTHDVGNYNATAASRKRGALACLVATNA